ncbi:MAG: hypothetical protein PUP46_08495 [Endozoicomonas sp. (ex Botrylloides leachii)]|nr:hypothetical protein [Endozoicomonas sp. (ex Botrylloides leachii)]
MPQITTSDLQKIVSQFEEYLYQKPSISQANNQPFNSKKLVKLQLEDPLKTFSFGPNKGHNAFVAALRACPEKRIIERGIKIIQNARYTGCSTTEEKQQVLSELLSITEGVDPHNSSVD